MEPYFRQVELDNYRGVRGLKVDTLARVNLIAGMNGAGKSTVLEALFSFLDLAGPFSFVRPLQWRNLPPSLEFARESLWGSAKDKPVRLNVRTRDGAFEQAYRWERLKFRGELRLQPGDEQAPPVVGDSDTGEGMVLNIYRNKNLIMKRNFLESGGTLAVNDQMSGSQVLPLGVMVSKNTLNLQSDTANRLSNVIRKGKKRKIVEAVRLILPETTDCHVLTIAGQPIIFLELDKTGMVPLALAGDGALTLMGLACALTDLEGGVVFIDEFDAAIHYSRLEEVWRLTLQLAIESDCQVFAATHSRECIDAAVRAAMSAELGGELRYIRLDRLKNRTVGTSYDAADLGQADKEDWEVR